MSINSLTGNPSVLLELSTALNLISPTTGITVLNGDNNITATVTGNTGAVKLNSIVSGLTSLSSEILYCGNGVDTGLQVSANSGGVFMNETPITNASFTNPFKTQPSSNGQVLASSTDGTLSWVNNGGSSLPAGSLVSLGGAYTSYIPQSFVSWLSVIPNTNLNGNATVGMSYYIDINTFPFTTDTVGNQYVVGIWTNGTSPPLSNPVSGQVFFSDGTYNNLSTKLYYTVQGVSDEIAVYIGLIGSTNSSVAGCSYSITGIVQ